MDKFLNSIKAVPGIIAFRYLQRRATRLEACARFASKPIVVVTGPAA